MKKEFLYYSIFFTIVIGLLIDAFHSSVLVIIIYFITFLILMLLTYKVFLVLKKGCDFVYARYFKEIITNIKKTKKTMQK